LYVFGHDDVFERRTSMVFENRALRNIFGTNKDEVGGQIRILHNDKLHDLCLVLLGGMMRERKIDTEFLCRNLS
jgi:hypothetical protein